MTNNSNKEKKGYVCVGEGGWWRGEGAGGLEGMLE
jgi:hypothetical protein